MNYSEQEQAEAQTRSFHDSISASSPVKKDSSMPDHESNLNVNNQYNGYSDPLNESISNSALLRALNKTQNLSQHSGQAMMQSTQQQQKSVQSSFKGSKKSGKDFSAPTTQYLQLPPQDYEKNFIINLKDDHDQQQQAEVSTDSEHPLMGEQLHDEKTFNISNLHSQQSSNMLDEMKVHHKSLERKSVSSPKFHNKSVKLITEGSQTAHEMINDPVFHNQFAVKSPPFEQDLKDYDLYAWGLNDNHQLGQLEISSEGRVVLIPRKVKDEFKIQDIKCSGSHSVILTKTGQVYVLGNNSHGQLGLSVQQHSIVSFPKEIPIQNVAQVATCQTHTLLLTNDGKLWATGLNANGQLGVNSLNGYRLIHDEFTEVTCLNNTFEQPMTIDKIFCTNNISGVVFKNNQIWTWGQNQGVQQVKMPHGCADTQFGNSILMLTKSGEVFQSGEDYQFEKIQSLFNVKEIAAFENNYACLDTLNNIYQWSADRTIHKLEKEANKSNLHFCKLTVGQEFGHVTDQYGNLHGWGNNKNGELGTGDSYPRKKLSQVRIFNSSKQYMRCKSVFSGSNFAFGLFESNILSGSTSFRKAASIQNTSRKGSIERESQYSATQQAIEKYREHAHSYKKNIVQASEDYNLYRPSQGSVRNTIRTSSGAPATREARSISPYQSKPFNNTTMSTMTEQKYSPDINVIVNHAKPTQIPSYAQSHQMSKSADNYSFSQLNYKFDENKRELQGFKNKLPEKSPDYKSYTKKLTDQNVQSNQTEGIRDFEKRVGSFGYDYPPTVTSIEELPQRPINSSINRRGEDLKYVIEKSINKTSDLLNNSRSQSHDVEQNQFKRFIKENTVYNYNEKQHPSMIYQDAYQSQVSVTHIQEGRNDTFAAGNLSNTFAANTSHTNDLLSNSKSTIEPQVIRDSRFINRDSSKPSKSNTERETTHKINKYKRKVKKYMTMHQDLQRQLDMQFQHNSHLQKQNDRLLKSDALGENLKSQMKMLEVQMDDMKQGYESIIHQKDCQIEEMAQENMHMVNEIEQRDLGHQTLEEKLEYVDNEIMNLAKQLQHSNKVNARLKEDLKKARARDKIVMDLEKRLDEQQNQELNELDFLRQALSQRDQECIEKQEEIDYLKQHSNMTIKENEIMARTLAELREKVAMYERSQELRNNDRKIVENMQKYQEQVNGLLSAKTTQHSQASWIQKHGPLVMNYTYDDNGTKRSSSYHRMSDRECQPELKNSLSFQPSLSKLENKLQYELENNKGEQYFISDPSQMSKSNLPTFEQRQKITTIESQEHLMNQVQSQRYQNPTFNSKTNITSSAVISAHMGYENQVDSTNHINPQYCDSKKQSASQLAPYRSKSGPSKLLDESSAIIKDQSRHNTIMEQGPHSPLYQDKGRAFNSFFNPPAETFPNYAYVKEHYLNGSSKSPIKKPQHQPQLQPRLQTFQPSPSPQGTNQMIFSKRDESPFQMSQQPQMPSRLTDYNNQPSKLTNYPHSPIATVRQSQLSVNASFMNPTQEPEATIRTQDLCNPTQDHTSPICNEKKLSKINQDEQKSSYINTILSKFERRTNTRVMDNMKARDAPPAQESRSCEPIRENNFAESKRHSRENSYGEIRSLDRIAAQNDKKTSVDQFKEKTRDWYLRRGRLPSESNHHDISQKYKAAFKNLSMELKKKIDNEYSRANESMDNKYLVSSAGTEIVRKVKPNVEEYYSLNNI